MIVHRLLTGDLPNIPERRVVCQRILDCDLEIAAYHRTEPHYLELSCCCDHTARAWHAVLQCGQEVDVADRGGIDAFVDAAEEGETSGTCKFKGCK